jgi:DNA-binding winged helix-turn-helix (wHTH) protein
VSGTIYTFGAFEVDTSRRQLRRDGEPVTLSERQFDILHQLVSHAGDVLSKDALIAAAWRDVAVTDNSLEQAVSAIRKLLAEPRRHDATEPAPVEHIRTVPRQGYRFTGTVTSRPARESSDTIEALLAPHRVWLEGRSALETLGREEAVTARRAFEQVLAITPDSAPAHIGMANACAFAFEATRADALPDREALAAATRHARDACALAPSLGEAWATLAFVAHLARSHDNALAAARRAVSLEPDNWRHHFRLAVVSWGEERLRAAQRTLTLLPGLALAHWLAATVHVARQALDQAERELMLGTAAQDEQPTAGRFAAVALHWLLGLVYLARGDRDAAVRELERELAFEAAGHLYARECCANAWYALGAIHLREGGRDAASRAFAEALQRVPGHVMAMVGLVSSRGDRREPIEQRARLLDEHGYAMEAAMARAGLQLIDGDAGAAAPIAAALAAAPPGSAGWTLPVEPLFNVAGDEPRWRAVLANLRVRAA